MIIEFVRTGTPPGVLGASCGEYAEAGVLPPASGDLVFRMFAERSRTLRSITHPKQAHLLGNISRKNTENRPKPKYVVYSNTRSFLRFLVPQKLI